MRFRLQRVLDLRRAQEQMAQAELARRQGEYRSILARIDRLLQIEAALFRSFDRQERLLTDVVRLQRFYEYLEQLEKELAQAEMNRQHALELVQRQWSVVRSCWQKRRMLEILKAKAEEAERAQLQKEEQGELDEQALFSFANRRREISDAR